MSLALSARLLGTGHRFATRGAIQDLIVEWDQPDQPVAFTWLCDKLKALKQLEEVGGKNYLSKIAGFAPTAAK
jgi:hypothetical protein